MRLIILFLMFVFSCFSCSLRKKSKVEVMEKKTETLKEEQKSEVQSVSNASTVFDSSEVIVYNDAVKEVVEIYKYAPPDTAGVQYIKEYTRTTRDKQSNAKQVSNTSSQSQTQDSVFVNSESTKNSYVETHTKTKTKEQVKRNPSVSFILLIVFGIAAMIFLRHVWKRSR